ncbi:hypothetical protein QR680_007087 [Steinernema hermaphroditum]|uniref:Uncharacterized protein n=1 Tax=Steinernema hermaphroditum TaxID=289476 RepID=A0AA39LXK7_9BILA|nr:hypothetical protein QR680_007087 [Steinernema hermaphroditum]
MNVLVLLVLLVFYADFALALQKVAIDCLSLNGDRIANFSESSVLSFEGFDWIASVSKSPLPTVPKAALVFEAFDTLLTIGGYKAANPVVAFLEEYESDMWRTFRKIQNLDLKDYRAVHQKLVDLGRANYIFDKLEYYFQATGIQRRAAFLCDMCQEQPAFILRELMDQFIYPNSFFFRAFVNVTRHGQEAMNLLRVEMQMTAVLLTGAAKMCSEVWNRPFQITQIEKDYNNLMSTLQEWENDRKKVVLESRVIPDYLLSEYYQKLSKDEKEILDYTNSADADESQRELRALAEKMSNDIGLHFNITVSIILIDYADELSYDIHADKKEYKKRFWRVDLGRAKAFLFAVEPTYVPQNERNGGISSSSLTTLTDLCHKFGRISEKIWDARKSLEINFKTQVKQRRYVGRTFRAPQPSNPRGVKTCQSDVLPAFGFRKDNLVVFAVKFVDHNA